MAADPPDSAGDMPQEEIDAALAAAGGAAEGSSTPPGDPAPVSNDPPKEATAPTPESDPAPGSEPSENVSKDNAEEAPAAAQDIAEGETPTDKMEAAVAEESEAAETAEASEAGAATEPVEAAEAAPQQQSPLPDGAVPMNFQDFAVGASSAGDKQSISLLNDVQLDVKIELGRANMLIEDVLKLGSGSVVELDKLAGDPVDVLVNDRLVARGEVLVLNDNFCVRISEILVGAQLVEASA